MSISLKLGIKLDRHKYTRTYYDMKNTNLEDLDHAIEIAPFDTAYIFDDMPDVFNTWNDILIETINRLIPRRTIRRCAADKPWFNNTLKHLINKRNRLYYKFKRTQLRSHYNNYINAKHEVKNKICELKDNYYAALYDSLDDPNMCIKKWWKITKEIYNGKIDSAIPPLTRTDGSFASSDDDKCSLLNDYFSKQCSVNSSNVQLPVFSYITDQRLNNINLTPDNILKILRNLDVSKATGPDGISNRILRAISQGLHVHLCKFLNFSLSHGVFPAIWKISNVIPIYKKGESNLVSNYRPISLLSCTSKVLEKAVNEQLNAYLRDNKLLSDKQSGFTQGDSTVNRLIDITNRILKTLDGGSEVRGVFLDISKAFDKVWHSGLIFKLRKMGIGGNLLNWLQSYLSNRTQCVVINGSMSDKLQVSAGVPQGSILGPILFLIYINDLTIGIQTEINLFADDTSLMDMSPNPQTSYLNLTNDLIRIDNWSKQWIVEFNPSKTYSITFSNKRNKPPKTPLIFKNEILEEVDQFKYLGVTFTADMSWGTHIDIITAKASKRIDQLSRLKGKLSRKTLKTLYFAMIRPILEYASSVFINCTNSQSKQLEAVQIRAASIITGAMNTTSHIKIINELGCDNLETRRTQSQLTLLYKINHNLTPNYLNILLPPTRQEDPRYNLRYPSNYNLIYARTEQYRKSFLPSALNKWNNLPDILKNAENLEIFKSRYTKLFCKTSVKYYTHGEKYSNTTIARFRMGFSKLNNDLFTRNLIPSPRCNCGHSHENSHHYFLVCPAYDAPRTQLLDKVMDHIATNAKQKYNQINRRLLNILIFGIPSENIEFNKALFNIVYEFIRVTGRF